MKRVGDDMVNMMLKQLGAESLKSTPAYVNIAKFNLVPGITMTYVYEIKEGEGIYLQRVSPYPMRIGKLYSEDDVLAFIEMDILRFQNAYHSDNFSRFIEITSKVEQIDRKIEQVFMSRNISPEVLDELDELLDKIDNTILKAKETCPHLREGFEIEI